MKRELIVNRGVFGFEDAEWGWKWLDFRTAKQTELRSVNRSSVEGHDKKASIHRLLQPRGASFQSTPIMTEVALMIA